MIQEKELRNKLSFWNRKRLPLIMQTETAECGLACIAMVAGFHGYKIDLVTLRRKFNLSVEGLTLHDIMEFSSRLDMSSRALRIEVDELKNLRTPCILHWDLNHFVVLKSVRKKKVTIFDPAKGERTYSLEEVSKSFTGFVLEMMPTKNFKIRDVRPELRFSDFWNKISGIKRSLISIISLSLLIQAFALASPFYMQLTIDNVILSADFNLMKLLIVGFFFLLLFEIVTNSIRGLSILYLSSTMSIQLASNIYHHLLRLPIDYFEKRHLGDVLSRFSSIQRVRELLTTGVVEVIIDGIMAALTLCMLFFYSPKLTVIVLIAVVLYFSARLAMYHSYKKISEQEIICRAKENTNFMESIRGIQTVKLFNSEVDRESIWNNLFVDAINQSIKLGQFQVSYGAINRLLFGIENLIVIYVAANLVISGGFSTGMLIAYIAYKRQFMDKIKNLVDKTIEFKMLSLHFDRLSDIVLTQREHIHPKVDAKHIISGNISVRDMSFKYSDSSPDVLKDINFEITAGESVAIVGPSGCGKSTLLKIMLGLVKPTTGTVFIDGQDLSEIDNGYYRNNIGAVMQQEDLFAGTIAENITFFSQTPNIRLVIKCCSMAAIHKDIMKMPMQYDTLIGDMGTNLSGGQKQRIILARALYKKPKILFMDEATSHLDINLESHINEAIADLKITRVIVAHRQETIQSAQRVIDLEELCHKS